MFSYQSRTQDFPGRTCSAWRTVRLWLSEFRRGWHAGARKLVPCPTGLLALMVLGLCLPQRLPAADIDKTSDSLTIRSGTYSCNDNSLKTISNIFLAGTYERNDKYPIGGKLLLGNPGWPVLSRLADRLNHDATLTFNGGFLEYAGQCLAPSFAGQAVKEQLRQIVFNSGQSQIRILNGNDVSSTTTLLVNDPTNGVIRKPGATLLIGGDDRRSSGDHFDAALGVAEKMVLTSGMAKYLKGGGGAAGSKSVSILPWMLVGTIYHPAMELATYDNVNGIRALVHAEYDHTSVLGSPERNVRDVKLYLGSHKTQTINSYLTGSYDNTDIGPGSVLTITSGFIDFHGGPGKIGAGDPAEAGTIDFGPAEGIIWANCWPSDGKPHNCIGSVIIGSGGLTKAGNQALVLTGANAYTGTTHVSTGVLQIGDGKLIASKLGNGDVEVAAGATLRIKAKVSKAIADTATVTLLNDGDALYGTLDLENGFSETVANLVLDGKPQPAGSYGSSASAAANKLDKYFSGPGILSVTAGRAGAKKTPAIPLSVSFPSQLTLETGGKLATQVVLANSSDKALSADVEFLVQQDPLLYSKPAPLALYGDDIAPGSRSWGDNNGRPYVESNDVWGRSNGKIVSINAMTDGRPWTNFGSVYNNKERLTEAIGYIDVGRVVRVVHMGYQSADFALSWKVDFAASLDGKQYAPIEGLQGVDISKRVDTVEIDVPKPFEARFIRLRLNNDGGPRVVAFRYPREFHIYAGATENTWAFPQAGVSLLQGKLTRAIPANGSSTVEVGDGRALSPGAYLVAVRTKAAGVTQMCYGHIFVMPPALGRAAAASHLGLKAADAQSLSINKRQGAAAITYDLRWSSISPTAGVYKFDGAPDSFFRACHEAGLPVLPCLARPPAYLASAKGPGDAEAMLPADLSKFGEFVFQAVARYGAEKHPAAELLTEDKLSGLGYVRTCELWREPNTNNRERGFKKTKGSTSDYYKMFRIGAEAARKADPGVKIANGGWWGLEVPLLDTMRTFKYPDGKCPLDLTDILSVHYYSPLGDVGSSYGIEPEMATIYDISHHHEGLPYERTIEQDLPALVAWRDANKPHMPIWMTEAVFALDMNDYLRACWLPRGVMMALAAGVDKVQINEPTWFMESGPTRDTGGLKPAWFTYATLIRQMEGVSGRALRVPTGDDNLRVYLWNRGGKPLLTAWAIKGTGKFNADLGRCTISDAFGGSQAADIRPPLTLGEFPIYMADFADSSAVEAIRQQATKLAEKERRRLERQSKLQVYLFKFGLKDQATMTIGSVRNFTPVTKADIYDEVKGYGFQGTGLRDEDVPWFQNPITDTQVWGPPGTRFTFKARPGEYVLQLCARPGQGGGKAMLSGLDGGDQTLQIPENGLIVTAKVKVGAKPVTLQTAFMGALVWMSLVEVE